ncbi:NUDIX hydrolase [Nocardioides solisilvae]|uniref:NUDIX hydrolase n=1 Tax=Nocardioides solisilvae TaxID=1542435 RepID=UPI000D7473DA|nr:NUDIX hydrolase [Nocardioides solisilvae]
MTPEPVVRTVGEGVARVTWSVELATEEFRVAVGRVSAVVEEALRVHARVEAWVSPDDAVGQRLATWAGMHREGVMRGVPDPGGAARDLVVYARVVADAPVGEPAGFRALLNSFLPRKRAISQLLLRDPSGRVLMCRLTYKRDWDLPGGVVEVGESPQLAVGREVEEELGLVVAPGRLLLTDWLPSWGGWDDALCLVFDGGVVEESVLETVVREEREIAGVQFCAPDEVRRHAADFTARRVEAALAALADGPGYTESGR